MQVEDATPDYPPLTSEENINMALGIAQSLYPRTVASWNNEPTLQAVFDKEEVGELCGFIAPLIVAGDANMAAHMRTWCSDWKRAIDAAILDWTAEFNKRFIQAQKTAATCAGARPGDYPDGEPLGVPEAVAMLVEARIQQQNAWDAATNDQTALRMFVEQAFCPDVAQKVHKGVQMLPQADERPSPPLLVDVMGSASAPVEVGGARTGNELDTSDPRYHYKVCADTTSFFLSLAADRCQIHAHAAKALRRSHQGACQCRNGERQLVQVPRIYDTGLCMYGSRECMHRMCCKFNILQTGTLEIERPADDLPSTMWDATPAWHGCTPYENMKLAKALARHVGIGAPFSSTRLQSNLLSGNHNVTAAETKACYALFEKSDVDAGSNTRRGVMSSTTGKRRRLAGQVLQDVDPNEDSDDEGAGAVPPMPAAQSASDRARTQQQAEMEGLWRRHARTNRSILMFNHPGLCKPGFDVNSTRVATLQLLLGFNDYELALALSDVYEERKSEDETRAMVRRQHCALLLRQFSRLVSADANGAPMHDYSMETLDSLYPGVAQTVDVVLQRVDFCKYEHVLDIGFVRELVRAIGLMTGPLAQNDEFMSGTRASGHAYCFVTGMSAGVLPDITPTMIAERLHLDPIEGANAATYDWLQIVNALWVFDAMYFRNCSIRKKNAGGVLAGQAGSSASGAATSVTNAFEWVVRLGEGDESVEIVGDYEPPITREDWINIRARVCERTNLLRWTANWPKVPSDLSIEQMGRNVTLQESKPARAINFLEITAQQLIYFPKTRAQGLEVLTGNNLRGFIEACGKATLNLEALAVMAQMQAPGDEPDDADEADEEAEDTNDNAPAAMEA